LCYNVYHGILTMSTYYSTLRIAPDASLAEIEAAYVKQLERYSPTLVENMDAELQKVAVERSAELQHIYAVLSDQERRRQYDISIGITPRSTTAQTPARRSLSPREQIYAIGGAVVALILVASIWLLTGRNNEQTRAMGEVNRPAPAIDLPTLDGGQIDLASFRGQVVLVNFWGTWCEPCRREMPALQSAYDQLRNEGFQVIGVNLADDEATNGTGVEEIREFVRQYGVTYPNGLDTEGSVTNAYRVFPLPTSFFIDAQGNIRYVHVGELNLEDIQARFKQLQEEAMALSAQ
jgi:cytochrome c biogenesis protein CcmG, thiol:disulfide interchange protein DsbE